MEAHPIPQNVTSFEFHLIGDMTVKQFAYLASGSLIGFFIYLTFSSIVPLVAWPLIIFFVLIGMAFAFLPISERPLDHWLLAYVKAITTPTQAVWKSDPSQVGGALFADRLKIYFGLIPMPQPNLGPAPKANSSTLSLPQTKSPPEEKRPTDKIKKKHSASILSRASAVLPVIKKSPPVAKQVEYKETLFIEPGQRLQTGNSIPETLLKPPAGTFFGPISLPETSISQQAPLPTTEELKETVELARKAHEVQREVLETEHQMNQIKSTAALPGADPTDFTEVFEGVVTKLQSLTKEESEISHEMALLSESHNTQQPQSAATPPPETAQSPVPPMPSVEAPPVTPPAITNIPQAVVAGPALGLHPLPKIAIAPIAKEFKSALITLNLTTIPNIINGIVTDAQNNYLEGVIVVTHDKQGLPVRALKTNKLGQFVAATPLPNGIYTLTVEKDNLNFDTVEVALGGQVLPAIMISAKKGVVV